MDQPTIDTYNKKAQEYDRETAEFWEKFPRDFLDLFIATSGTKVLDVGSGPGRDGALLREAGKEVVCLDASEEMVKLSAERGLQSVLGDFMKLPFQDESFDGVWAYTSLLHVSKQDMGKAFDEIARVLKGGGIFGLGLIEGDTEEHRENMGEGLPRLFSYYREGEVALLATAHGFSAIAFSSITPGPRNFLHFIFKKAGKGPEDQVV